MTIYRYILVLLAITSFSCKKEVVGINYRISTLSSAEAQELSKKIRSTVTATLDDDLELTLWASDSLLADPIALDIDDEGRVYITRTNRQKNSEFDIRGHKDWETRSIALQSVDDKRAFLHAELSPDRSEVNSWLADLNGDSSHDWRDLTIEKEQVFRVIDRDQDGLADYSHLLFEGLNDEVNDPAGAF